MNAFNPTTKGLLFCIAIGVLLSGCIGYREAIHFDAQRGDIRAIKKYLKAGGDINLPTNPIWISGSSARLTPLHFAVRGGQIEAAAYLIEQGANIEADSQDGRPLYLATNLAEVKVMELLLAKGASILDSTAKQETLLHVAIAARNLSAEELHRTKSPDRRTVALKVLLDYGVLVDSLDRNGQTALMRAAEWHNLPALELLLQRGANINAQDKLGKNALFGISNQLFESDAVRRRMELETFYWLDKHEADVGQIDREGNSLLHYSCNLGISRALIDRNLDVNLKNKAGYSPLHYVAASGGCELPLVQLLVNAGAEIEAKNNLGVTPLHLLLGHEANIEKIRYLLTESKNLSVIDNKGTGLTHVVALVDRQSWVVAKLQRRGVDIDQLDNAGCSALHWAVSQNTQSVINSLLMAGADPNRQNAQGQSALHIAAGARRPQNQPLQMLLDFGAQRDLADSAGYYPFHMASLPTNNQAAVELLLTDNIKDISKPGVSALKNTCSAVLYRAKYLRRRF